VVDGLLVRIRTVVDSGDREGALTLLVELLTGGGRIAQSVPEAAANALVATPELKESGMTQAELRWRSTGESRWRAMKSSHSFCRHHLRLTISWLSSKPSVSGWHRIMPHARPQPRTCSRPPVAKRSWPSLDARAGSWPPSSAVATSS
jgi:hypothetical protein